MTITDADREAAASFIEQWKPGPEMTVVKLARAFARHRIAGRREGLEMAAKACEAVETDMTCRTCKHYDLDAVDVDQGYFYARCRWKENDAFPASFIRIKMVRSEGRNCPTWEARDGAD